MATSDKGLGSPNMSEKKKQQIHSMGGQASHSGGTSRSSSSGRSSNLSQADRAKGGRASRSS